MTIEAPDLRDPAAAHPVGRLWPPGNAEESPPPQSKPTLSAAAHCVGADWPPGNRDDPRPPPSQPTVSAADLPLAERACALAEEHGTYGRWNYLDTLALAQHRTGDTAKAIETQRRALGLIPPKYHQPRKEMQERLAEYDAALAAQATSGGLPP